MGQISWFWVKRRCVSRHSSTVQNIFQLQHPSQKNALTLNLNLPYAVTTGRLQSCCVCSPLSMLGDMEFSWSHCSRQRNKRKKERKTVRGRSDVRVHHMIVATSAYAKPLVEAGVRLKLHLHSRSHLQRHMGVWMHACVCTMTQQKTLLFREETMSLCSQQDFFLSLNCISATS